MEGSDSVRGESGVVAVRMRAWSARVRTLTSGVHDRLCLLLGGEEPLDPVLRFHGCACPGENCRSPRRNFPSTFEDETQLSNAEVTVMTDTDSENDGSGASRPANNDRSFRKTMNFQVGA